MNRLNRWKRPLRTAVILTAGLCMGHPAWAVFGVTGGNWDIDALYPGWHVKTAEDKWTASISGANAPYSLYISVAGQGAWSPSDTGNNGVNTFVVRELGRGVLVSTTPAFLAAFKELDSQTYKFGLNFLSPADGSTEGNYTFTVTLAAEPSLPSQIPQLGLGEWWVIHNELAVVGTGDGNYLMWPRPVSCAGTNNGTTLKWSNYGTSYYTEPVWDNGGKYYTYPGTSTAADYPAFQWAEGLDWWGETDWRVPTLAEATQLQTYGAPYIYYNTNFRVSSPEASATQYTRWYSYYVWTGLVTKITAQYVVAVRKVP